MISEGPLSIYASKAEQKYVQVLKNTIPQPESLLSALRKE